MLAAGDVAACCKSPTNRCVLRLNEPLSCRLVHATHAFETAESHVGEPVSCQLALRSSAHQRSEPITFSEVTLTYEGRVQAIVLRHRLTAPATTPIARIVLVRSDLDQEPKHAPPPTHLQPSDYQSKDLPLVGYADLRIFPGQVKVFGFELVLRDAGEVKALKTTFTLDHDLFQLDYTVKYNDGQVNAVWWVDDEGTVRQKRIVSGHPSVMKILPRLPKMDFKTPTLTDRFYTDERVSIELEILNGEEEQSQASLEIRLLGQSEDTPDISWCQHASKPETLASADVSGNREGAHDGLPGYQIGNLLPSHSAVGTISFIAGPSPVDYVLELKVLYHLESDKETPVSKTLALSVSIVRPFEANFDFSPQLHPDEWPSLFSISPSQRGESCGIAQLWGLTARVASFATQDLVIEGINLPILAVSGGIDCEIVQTGIKGAGTGTISPHASQETQFLLDVKKLSLDDRRPAALSLALSIQWRRNNSGSGLNTSCLTIPRLLIPSGEPRVLASAESSTTGTFLVYLDYTLENPSMHFLTFSLTMEASEEFTFSGPKFSIVQLVPLSRRTVRFMLMPYPTTHGRWVRPQLHVVDRYFQKSLEITIIRGSKETKMGEKGMLVWVDPAS